MARQKLRDKIEAEVKKSVLSYAFYRPESAIIIAMTIVLAGLTGAAQVMGMQGIFTMIPWWAWLAFGAASEGLIIWSTLNDEDFYRKIVEEMFKQEFNVKKLRSKELQKKLDKALEYRELIIKEIAREEDPVLDDYLMEVVKGLEEWIAQLYHLAAGLDNYRRDTMLQRDMAAVPQDIKRFKTQLSNEKDEVVSKELKKTIAAKEAQWKTLKNLRETMTRAELQIENAIAAMGTVYSQVALLSAKDIDSTRVQRLQADMTEQVYALEDISAAMDEVYQVQ